MDDVKLALLSNKEASKRLTDAGVRIPCRCGAKGEIITMAKYGENRRNPAVIRCPKCHYEACFLPGTPGRDWRGTMNVGLIDVDGHNYPNLP